MRRGASRAVSLTMGRHREAEARDLTSPSRWWRIVHPITTQNSSGHAADEGNPRSCLSGVCAPRVLPLEAPCSRASSIALVTTVLWFAASSSADDGKCPDAHVTCDDRCVDMSRHRDHCGACGMRCADGFRCEASVCKRACPASQLACGDLCVTPTLDPRHCGGCGQACGSDSYCERGQCKTFRSALTNYCPTGLTMCGSNCRDTNIDEANCGGCNKACGDTQVCRRGRCLSICPTPEKSRPTRVP